MPAILKDKYNQIIREYDILKVFHYYGRKRGKGHEKHYMYKIAKLKFINEKYGNQWYFYHTAELKEGYWPSLSDKVLEEVEVIDSPATLHDWCESNRIK